MQDVDSKKAHTEVDKTWIACVRDMTYDVEDIIDEFTRIICMSSKVAIDLQDGSAKPFAFQRIFKPLWREIRGMVLLL